MTREYHWHSRKPRDQSNHRLRNAFHWRGHSARMRWHWAGAASGSSKFSSGFRLIAPIQAPPAPSPAAIGSGKKTNRGLYRNRGYRQSAQFHEPYSLILMTLGKRKRSAAVGSPAPQGAYRCPHLGYPGNYRCEIGLTFRIRSERLAEPKIRIVHVDSVEQAYGSDSLPELSWRYGKWDRLPALPACLLCSTQLS